MQILNGSHQIAVTTMQPSQAVSLLRVASAHTLQLATVPLLAAPAPHLPDGLLGECQEAMGKESADEGAHNAKQGEVAGHITRLLQKQQQSMCRQQQQQWTIG